VQCGYHQVAIWSSLAYFGVQDLSWASRANLGLQKHYFHPIDIENVFSVVWVNNMLGFKRQKFGRVHYIIIVLASLISLPAGADDRCDEINYYLDHIDECEGIDNSGKTVAPPPPVIPPRGSEDTRKNQGDDGAGSPAQNLEPPECTSGSLPNFSDRVKSETSELAKTIQDIESVKPAISITNLCDLTLEKLDQSVSILKRAVSGDLQKQAQETGKCFSKALDWIEKSHSESLGFFKYKLLKIKKDWELQSDQLENKLKWRTTDLQDYEKMKDLYSCSCLGSSVDLTFDSSRCKDDDYYLEHIDQCEGVDKCSNQFPDCTSSLPNFFERVKSETSELAKTIQEVDSVKSASSIIDFCGLTLEKLDQSISILKQAARGGLLEQAETTGGCFDDVFDWIEKSYGKSPIRPFDVLKHNQLIIVRRVKKHWELQSGILKSQLRGRSTDLEDYMRIKQIRPSVCR